MIPLKDDIPARHPPVVTFLAIAAAALAHLVAGRPAWPSTAADGPSWWPPRSCGCSPRRWRTRWASARFVVFLVAGGALTWALDPGAAVAGSVAAVVGAYAVLYPRAHVVALSLVPGFMTVTQVPALAVLVLWLPLQALAGGLEPAPLAGLAAGALAARLLAHRVQHDYQRAPAF